MAASARLEKTARLESATRVFENGFQVLSLQTLNKKGDLQCIHWEIWGGVSIFLHSTKQVKPVRSFCRRV